MIGKGMKDLSGFIPLPNIPLPLFFARKRSSRILHFVAVRAKLDAVALKVSSVANRSPG